MKIFPAIITTALLLLMVACTGSDSNEATPQRSSANQAPQFTEFELEHGIGPVKERIELGPIVQAMVDQGRTIYEMKCEMCHSMDTRMVGPALGDVMDRRSPEFVMNMILNPNEMAQKHPDGREMLQQYMTVMPFQNVQYDEARAIVEYLRTVAENQ
jgi:cytochrome c5